MTVAELIRLPSRAAWAVIGLLAACAIVMAWCAHDGRQKAREAAARATASAITAEAGQAAAVEAMDATTRATAVARQSEDLTRSNRDEILSAPGADALVDPGLSAAALRSLCKRAAYREHPRCDAVRAADRGEPAR